MADHPSVDQAYQLLVSREDRRYHAVWDREIFVLAGPDRGVLPSAVCGRGGCEPYDESGMSRPRACSECFPWLRANAPEATCVGAPRRNLAVHRETGVHRSWVVRAGMASPPADLAGPLERTPAVVDGVRVGMVMTEHPGWSWQGGSWLRAVRSDDSVWVLTAAPAAQGIGDVAAHAVRTGGVGQLPAMDVYNPRELIDPASVVAGLRGLGPVARWRNPEVWDALATAVLRQVIRAGQARKLYQAFSQAHGEPIDTPIGGVWVFPTPSVVLGLPDGEFSRLGLAFKRPTLRAAAEAVLAFGEKWAGLTPAELAVELRSVPRVGPWTAGAAVADLSNNYALYPYADLAVRTWAARLAPEQMWPKAEDDFARVWSRLAGDRLGAWTLLTLAWGNRHVNGAGL
ncbi:hypothetical protein GCM10023321_81620 [Pseudonocardia eucalypti]|uniref:DNA-3-methyladenine glycosylase II n=1 Tax=Pseudonocardia eucalypti TaxID=648755 RepID=A0ABP9REH4_9PSEU|nr:hypothetical protein [Pseudonocardia eucalypti]